ncbi:hypothetical protein [Pontibacillus sp. HMF3514]|uniref:hypothetical protein n=1 Tax=Pontibacillus sp. HMF3514 TaxID=2692425 RepID=UPI00131FE06C|nr:hypothetical protein [Pontibacillus sp. HMF3514]QHE52417.1 hypothetical protein GS400_10375 [Pontibacillus sp. HMF3514]
MAYQSIFNVSPPNPDIKSIETNYPKNGIWVQIPKGTDEITFNVKAENTQTVLFWLISTGTQTWTERILIGYDIKENDTDNIFTLNWKINKDSLHDHLHVQGLGENPLNFNKIIHLYKNQ